MNSALMFSKASDNWSTPQALFDALDAEFRFTLDAAASAENAKCVVYLGPGSPLAVDALAVNWTTLAPGGDRVYLNPPYSKCRQFIAHAVREAGYGSTVVCLVPSRTDTRFFHEHVWDREKHQPRAGVEIRFLKGRVKFGEGKNSAPFPSVVIIFRGAR